VDSAAVSSLVVSALSLVVSVVSAVVAVHAMRTTTRIAAKATNLQLHNFGDEICRANPALYEFHGITLADLTREGVSPDELSYVVHSFDAAQAYHEMRSASKVTLSEYRRNMLLHPKVRKIWKLFVVGKTLNPSPFTEAVDRYIAEVERTASASAERDVTACPTSPSP
jgi:hypothetical protein